MARASVAYVIVYIAIAAWAPYLAPYYRSLNLPLEAIGLLMAMTSAVALLSAPIWGMIHDRLPQSRTLIPLASAILAVGCFGLAGSGASWLLVPSAAAFAVGASGLTPMMDVRVLDMAAADRTRYARVRVWGSISFMVAAPLVGVLINHQGPGALFWVLAPAALVGGLATVLLPARTSAVRAPSLRRAPGVVLGHRPIALFLIGALVGWTAVAAQNAFFSIYLAQLGASSDIVGWAWSVAALLEVPAMFFFPVLARRFGVERLIVAGSLILVVRQAANVVFTDPALLVGFSLIQGLGYSLLLIGGITFVSRRAPMGTAATAQGILTAVASSSATILGSGLGGVVAGWLGIRGLYAVASCLGIAAVGLIALAVLPAARREAPGS
jgi:PPP family 3-phenylpropionic acid transporter